MISYELGTKIQPKVFLTEVFGNPLSGPEKGVIKKRGLFAGGISGISKFSKFSRISRKWSDSPLFSTVWGVSRISKFSRISRKWTFLKRPLFPNPTLGSWTSAPSGHGYPCPNAGFVQDFERPDRSFGPGYPRE